MLDIYKATGWLEIVLPLKARSNLDFLSFKATRIAQCENVLSEMSIRAHGNLSASTLIRLDYLRPIAVSS